MPKRLLLSFENAQAELRGLPRSRSWEPSGEIKRSLAVRRPGPRGLEVRGAGEGHGRTSRCRRNPEAEPCGFSTDLLCDVCVDDSIAGGGKRRQPEVPRVTRGRIRGGHHGAVRASGLEQPDLRSTVAFRHIGHQRHVGSPGGGRAVEPLATPRPVSTCRSALWWVPSGSSAPSERVEGDRSSERATRDCTGSWRSRSCAPILELGKQVAQTPCSPASDAAFGRCRARRRGWPSDRIPAMSVQAASTSDTRMEAHREQIRLLREAGLARRFQAARSLTGSVIELARCRVRKRMPEASEAEVARATARELYGERLLRALGVEAPENA